MNTPARILTPLITVLLLGLAACGGGDDEPAPAPPPPPPPPAGTMIGTGGGTVTGPSGSSVVIPAGALGTQVLVLIEQTSTGAPGLPRGATSIAPIFATTPHGTTFTAPVTVTLPFDPTQVPAGRSVELYKTNAQNQWERVTNAVFGTTTVTAQVTGFSYWAQTFPQLANGRPVYQWEVIELLGEALTPRTLDDDIAIDADFQRHYDLGPATRDADVFAPNGSLVSASNGLATAQFAGAEDGADWFVGTEAPRGVAAVPDSVIGSKAVFQQTQSYIKRDADARLSFWVLSAFMEVSDENGILGRRCPTVHQIGLYCNAISAQIYFSARAFTVPASPFTAFDYFYTLGGSAELTGIAGSWDSRATTAAFSHEKLWDIEDFTFDIETIDGHEEALVTMELAHPIFHEYPVDLSGIAVGQAFTLEFTGITTTYNRAAIAISGIGTEFPTSARSYLRDPRSPLGVAVNAAGVEAIDTVLPVVRPVEVPVVPVACPSPDPLAGQLEFSAATFRQSEADSLPVITVIRTGGTRGSVTVTFETVDGSAIAGTHYTPLRTTVRFADGDDAPRTVEVSSIQNSTHSEPDRTVNLVLSQPGGCASLGDPSAAVLTLQDDDAPPPPPTFTVGGTVTGLVGTGLQIDDLHFRPITPGNGAFTMLSPTQMGRPYEVRVTTQPTNPVQVCTVVNGSGTMGNTNVTDVEVNCAAPVAGGGLDNSFGGTGKVAANFGGDDSAMVIQPDGKIIMVGGPGNFFVARYNADGTLDDGFGTAGLATTDIAGGSDRAQAVALQSDGKIVVAGYARVGASDDFAVVRYHPNGTPDTGFGTAGKATVDFFGTRNRANAVAIASDGQILVAGDTVLPAAPGDFALVRFSASGVLDTTFGGTTDGKVTTDIVGGVDIAKNIVVESSGTILVTGVITLANDPSLVNLGAARYSANGVLDSSFDIDGKLSINAHSVGEALALQADGKLLLAGTTSVAGDSHFALMRLNTNGAVDLSFGTQGMATAGFSTLDDFGRGIALQADGKILVSGQTSNQSNPNFALARFLPGGTLDNSFDGDGKLTVDFFGAGDNAENVAVQADGRIVLGGYATNGFALRFGLARIQP